MPKGADDDHLSSLVSLAREGDRKAYGKIFRLCYKDIYDYVSRRVGNREDVEDLVMQVFAKGLVAVAGYEERGYSVKAWLYRIAHNAVVDHWRSSGTTVGSEDLPETASDVDVEGLIASRDELDGLYKELVGLPTAQAEVLVLRFIEDMSVSETAMILDKKEVTVRALQFKGINNLRKRMMELAESEMTGKSDD